MVEALDYERSEKRPSVEEVETLRALLMQIEARTPGALPLRQKHVCDVRMAEIRVSRGKCPLRDKFVAA